jgi:hypothetical protein
MKKSPRPIIEYADDVFGPYKLYDVPIKTGPNGQRPGQDQMGYGARITSDIVLVFDRAPKKKFRVYCTCWSNAASHWVMLDRRKLHLRTHFQSDILPGPPP